MHTAVDKVITTTSGFGNPFDSVPWVPTCPAREALMNRHKLHRRRRPCSTRHSTRMASLMLIVVTALSSCNQTGETTPSGAASDKLDRTILPILEPKRQSYKELDARNAKAPARWEVKAPAGAPNVVVVLIDDMGLRCFERIWRTGQYAEP